MHIGSATQKTGKRVVWGQEYEARLNNITREISKRYPV